jgi:predicted nucleic acid-binding protein
LRSYVVDASVGAKWCLPSFGEEFVYEAASLLEGFKLKQVRLIVPDLFWTEVANALWKAVRKNKLSLADASTSFSLLQATAIPTLPSTTFLPQALTIAGIHARTVYDCLYVALAVESSMEVITADERMANALAAYYPVRWLGGLQY